MTNRTISAEDLLALIEAQNQMADVIDMLKKNLEERGWHPIEAQRAAIATVPPMLIEAMVHQNAKARMGLS